MDIFGGLPRGFCRHMSNHRDVSQAWWQGSSWARSSWTQWRWTTGRRWPSWTRTKWGREPTRDSTNSSLMHCQSTTSAGACGKLHRQCGNWFYMGTWLVAHTAQNTCRRPCYTDNPHPFIFVARSLIWIILRARHGVCLLELREEVEVKSLKNW